MGRKTESRLVRKTKPGRALLATAWWCRFGEKHENSEI
jgi:hypothetical protein